MVYKKKIPEHVRQYAKFLHLKDELSIRQISKKCRIPKSSVHRIVKKKVQLAGQIAASKRGRGRPSKLSQRDRRMLQRNIIKLREENGNFASKRLMQESSIDPENVSNRTVRRNLNDMDYFYLQARKKGLLSEMDRNKRVSFAKNVRKNYPADLWTRMISFYIDGAGFVHKTNPFDQACAAKGRVWRKRSEGLRSGCTSKGSKAGSGGRVVRLMVAISYNRGVICCKQYNKMLGVDFASFIREEFDELFNLSDKDGGRLFLQDGDPCQNAKVSKIAMSDVNANLFSIPARSPDLNPIENVFKLIKDQLHKDAIRFKIRRESYDEFSKRLINTVKYSIPLKKINNIIRSMDKRVTLLHKNGGERLKY